MTDEQIEAARAEIKAALDAHKLREVQDAELDEALAHIIEAGPSRGKPLAVLVSDDDGLLALLRMAGDETLGWDRVYSEVVLSAPRLRWKLEDRMNKLDGRTVGVWDAKIREKDEARKESKP
jgi:hypothetical protein